MIAPAVASVNGELSARLHSRFLSVLPRIENYAQFAFRDFPLHAAEDLVQETICISWKWFRRLAAKGKDPSAFPTAIARLACRAAKSGRRVGRAESARDILSATAQKRHGFWVERLDEQRDATPTHWKEAVLEDPKTSPADAATFRCDFSEWLERLTDWDRRMVEEMVLGARTKDLAARFRVTSGRVSQLRKEYQRAWNRFHGEPVASVA
jgi:DNA-directed RNA polymerase specialized sigma24 family protein